MIVCDFPVPGGPLDDQVPPFQDVLNRESLRAVSVDDMEQLVRLEEGIKIRVIVVANALAESVPENRIYQRVVRRLRSRWPSFGV